MNLRLWITALLITSLSVLRLAAAPEAGDPTKVVQDLYHSAQSHFGFSPDTVKADKPWLAPALYAKIWKKVNQPTPKGDAPDIEGDLFLDSQDGPTKFEVGNASIDKTKAKVSVTLIWPSETRHQTVLLEQIDGAWKVTDVDYGDKEGKLTDLLK
jgi:Protein of unknown function (DUF3828)